MTTRHGVLVVDDSRTARTLLAEILAGDPQLSVVGQAADGAEAVALVKRLRPSIVVMDIEMPDMNGFEATKRIMIEQPTPIVIVTANYEARAVEVGLQALHAGALTVVPKPAGPTAASFGHEAKRLVTLVNALADMKVVRQRERPLPIERSATATLGPADGARRLVEVVGVAASTGGPAALCHFLELLPATFDAPVLVVQHIAAGFVDGLARWLGATTHLPVSVATDGVEAEGGAVYIAPDARHLVLRSGRLRLSDAPPVGGFRPSANVLFGSLAASHGPRAAGVVLTGMGDDGVDGARQLRSAGGLVCAQDAGTSAVFGMPRAVAAAGLADVVGTVDELAYRIALFAPKRG